jgi:hypothetical protein
MRKLLEGRELMSDITHSDWCPVGNTGELEDCAHCVTEHERQKAYYSQMFRWHYYSSAEIPDAYSSPSEYQKREGLLRRIER